MKSRPKVGETLEISVWLDGRETEEHLARFSTQAHRDLLEEADVWNVVIGPPHAVTKRPGEPYVPLVPARISGPDVRLLVIEAHVLGNAPRAGDFLEAWDAAALSHARKHVRQGYAEMMAAEGFLMLPRLTDRQCDTILGDLGEEQALGILRSNGIDPELVKRTLH